VAQGGAGIHGTDFDRAIETYNLMSNNVSPTQVLGFIYNVRATGRTSTEQRYSNGIVPMLRVFNNTARYVDQCVVPETFIFTLPTVPNTFELPGQNRRNHQERRGGVIKDVLEYGFTGEMYKIFTEHSIEH
jgi:hypothetical protein